jgi:hypothetical protein
MRRLALRRCSHLACRRLVGLIDGPDVEIGLGEFTVRYMLGRVVAS